MSFRKIQTSNIDTSDAAFSDPILILGKDNSGISDIGFLGKIGINNYAGFVRDAETQTFYVIDGYIGAESSNQIEAAQITQKGNLSVGVLTADTLVAGNLPTQYTDADARSAISATGSLSYDSATGVISFTDTDSSYATKVGYNLADETDTTSIVLNSGDANTPATFRGDIINDSGTVIVDVSSTSSTFTGGLMGNTYGDVYNPTGADKILESGTGNLDSILTVDSATTTTLNAGTTNISGIATFTGGSVDFTGTNTLGNWNGAVYDRTGSTLIIEDDAALGPIVHAYLDGHLTGNVTGNVTGNILNPTTGAIVLNASQPQYTLTGNVAGNLYGDVISPTQNTPIITTGATRDLLTIHDVEIEKLKAPTVGGVAGSTIINTTGADTFFGHNAHLTGSLYGDIGDTVANSPVLTVGTGNNDSQLSVAAASIDDLTVKNPVIVRTLTHQAISADHYTKQYVLAGTTTDATETELFVRGAPNERIPVATDTTIFYDISFVARRTDATGESAGFELKGVVDNFAGTVADVGDLYEILVASDNTNLVVEATADDTNDAIKISVTGEASKTFRWTAIVKTTEVAQ